MLLHVDYYFSAVVPHITDGIQDWVERVASQPVDKSGCIADVCIIEVCRLKSESLFFTSTQSFLV